LLFADLQPHYRIIPFPEPTRTAGGVAAISTGELEPSISAVRVAGAPSSFICCATEDKQKTDNSVDFC
jgi:hypothetical protein